MPSSTPHILYFPTLESFFDTYRVGCKPHSAQVSCMRLEDQSPNRLQLMPLFRGNFYKITFFSSERVKSMVPEKPAASVANGVYFGYPGKLESWMRTGDLKGIVVYFTGDYLGLNPSLPTFDQEYPFFTYDSEFYIMVTDEESHSLMVTANEMLQEINSANPDRFEVLKPLLRLYLHKVRRAYARQVEKQSAETQSRKAIFNKFRKALDNQVLRVSQGEIKDAPSVAALAAGLNLNPNYLNMVIKEVSGKTASSFIQERLLLEAKAYLMHSNLQVAEIAFKLGFENPPYFNRFFKKLTASSPLTFRKTAQGL